MRRNLPKISSLQCFDAAAQHLSMTYAGETLHLTQSAVSKQIKNLEETLGRDLFYRQDGQLILTPVGEQFAAEVRYILSRLEKATDQAAVSSHTTANLSLKLVTEPTLAMRWLVPKLTEFNSIYPHIEVDLNTDFLAVQRNIRKCDFAILFGNGDWADCSSEFLRKETLVAVATPKLMAGWPKAENYEDVLGFTFLHHNHPISSTAAWLKAAGKSDKEIAEMQGGHYEHFTLLAEAVRHGLGVSILPRYLVEEDLSDGNLVLACEKEFSPAGAYYIVYCEDRKDEYAINHFRKWLLTHRESAPLES